MSITSFPFKVFSISIGKSKFKVARIVDHEKLFDEFLKKDSRHPDVIDERIPYWGDVWPSAIGLSEFIAENSLLVKGKDVLEIGCGMGLPGIVAAINGARVTLTDYLPDALDFAAYNWNLNIDAKVKTQLLDWRNPGKISPADVLLASDVAYESRSFKPLLVTLKSLIKADGIILISEPNRAFAKSFFDEIRKMSFSIMEEKRNVIKDDIKYSISVYLLRQ